MAEYNKDSKTEAKPLVAASVSQAKVWSITKRREIAMITGVLLYGAFSHLILAFDIPGTHLFYLIFPTLLIPLFFGVIFGPWVGLCTGGIGFLIGEYISELNIDWSWYLGHVYISYPLTFNYPTRTIAWYWVLSNALIGFIAGLALLKTAGLYRSIHAIVIAAIFGLVAVAVGLGFALYSLTLTSNFYTLGNTSNDLVRVLPPNMIFCFVLLPVLLVIYIAIVRYRT